MVKFGPDWWLRKKVPWSSSLIRVVVRERRALLIVAYGLMEAEEVSDLVDLSLAPELDSEVEV